MQNLDIGWLNCTVFTVLETLVHSAICKEIYAQLICRDLFWGLPVYILDNATTPCSRNYQCNWLEGFSVVTIKPLREYDFVVVVLKLFCFSVFRGQSLWCGYIVPTPKASKVKRGAAYRGRSMPPIIRTLNIWNKSSLAS